MVKDSQLIDKSYSSITSAVFRIFPRTNIPFSLYRLNTSNGKFSAISTPNKTILSTEKQSILADCDKGLIFIKNADIAKCRPYFAANLKIFIADISHSIPEQELALILIKGLKKAAETIYVDSVKIHFKAFHETLMAAGELIFENPDILLLMIPLLEKSHSLVNKSISNGIIGAAVILLGRESKPGINAFLDAFSALFLCDIGLCTLPEFVLGKEFCLTLDEQKRVRHHPISSVEQLSVSNLINKPAMRAILEHHERMDGSGYPRGVTNEQLSWLGKLCGTVDSFVAMTMKRPGKKSMPVEKALKILYKESTQYDPNIIYALEKVTYRD